MFFFFFQCSLNDSGTFEDESLVSLQSVLDLVLPGIFLQLC